jgi:hypothetical protein
LNVPRLRYTTSTENEASLKIAEKYGFAKVLEMGVFWHPDPKTIPSTKSYPHIRKSTFNEVHTLLKGSPHVIPHKILVYDWKVLDATLESLETLSKVHEFYIALKKVQIDSLSYGSSRSGPDGSMWIFTIFATDLQGFLSHLSHNIALASERGLAAIMGTYELDFEEALHDVDWISAERWGTHMVLLERIMR